MLRVNNFMLRVKAEGHEKVRARWAPKRSRSTAFRTKVQLSATQQFSRYESEKRPTPASSASSGLHLAIELDSDAATFFQCTLEAPEVFVVFLFAFASHCDFVLSDLTKINGDMSMISPVKTAIHIVLPMIFRCALLSLTSIS